MKKLMILMSCAMLMLAVGCKKNDEPKPDPQPDPQPQPEVLDSISGSVSQPSWAAPESYDMTASMTAIVSVDLSLTYPKQVEAEKWKLADGDLLAAFCGDKCLGVDTLEADRNNLFFLYIAGLNNEDIKDVQLRYYSKQVKNIFKSNSTFSFSNDSQLGSVGTPYTPEWTKQ